MAVRVCYDLPVAVTKGTLLEPNPSSQGFPQTVEILWKLSIIPSP
jgi:hypothetical protein